MNCFFPVKRITATLISVGFSLSVFAEGAPAPVFNEGNTELTLNGLVTQVVNNNAQIIYADIQRRIAKEKITFEEGVYETEFFSDISYDDAHTQRSAEDKLNQSLSAQNKQILDESNSNFSMGFRRLISTGGEVTLSYLTQEKDNNIIPASTDPSVRESEFTTALSLEYTQPLLKGLGNAPIETRIERARIEDKIVAAQYRQEMLQVIFDASSSYWELYKIMRFISVREAALANAKSTLKDIERKANSGKKSQNEVFGAKTEVLKRKIALDGVLQARTKALYKISSLLNVNPNRLNEQVFKLDSQPDTSEFRLDVPFEDYLKQVLLDWPNYQILKLNMAMQDQEIKLVNDELKPQLDLTMGYTLNQLEDDFDGAVDGEYPSWYIGLNFSMPIGGNDRIKAKKAIAMLKRKQQHADLHAVQVGLENDLKAKLFQVEKTYQEVVFLTENIALLEELFKAKKQKFELGYGELTDVYSLEDDLNLERQRLIEGQIRYELAKVALALADGTLVKEYM